MSISRSVFSSHLWSHLLIYGWDGETECALHPVSTLTVQFHWVDGRFLLLYTFDPSDKDSCWNVNTEGEKQDFQLTSKLRFCCSVATVTEHLGRWNYYPSMPAEESLVLQHSRDLNRHNEEKNQTHRSGKEVIGCWLSRGAKNSADSYLRSNIFIISTFSLKQFV